MLINYKHHDETISNYIILISSISSIFRIKRCWSNQQIIAHCSLLIRKKNRAWIRIILSKFRTYRWKTKRNYSTTVNTFSFHTYIVRCTSEAHGLYKLERQLATKKSANSNHSNGKKWKAINEAKMVEKPIRKRKLNGGMLQWANYIESTNEITRRQN